MNSINSIPFGNVSEFRGLGEPFQITESNRYHLIFVKKVGEFLINFKIIPINGFGVVALCPDEVFLIKDYEMLFAYSFSYIKHLGKFDQFIKVFGTTRKVFVLDEHWYNSKEFVGKFILTSLINAREKLAFLFDYLATKDVSEKEFQVQRFIILVHEHHKTQHRLDFYAKNLGMTPKHLSELFNELGIDTPHHFIKHRIAVEAKRLLVFTQKSSREICYDIGFNDPTYFSRFFKKNVGLNPKAFRLKWQRLLDNFNKSQNSHKEQDSYS